jgi:hypothetical protein
MSEPTNVTITAQLAADPNLKPRSVKLLKYDASYKLISNLGRLYDDGTHGDSVAGDNVFTAQIVINVPIQTTTNFRVSVAYKRIVKRKGMLKRLFSDYLPVRSWKRLTEGDMETILTAQAQSSRVSDEKLTQLGYTEQARNEAISTIKTLDGVKDAGISADGTTIWIEYANGMTGVVLTGPEGTFGGEIVSTGASAGGASLSSVRLGDLSSTVSPPLVNNNRILIWDTLGLSSDDLRDIFQNSESPQFDIKNSKTLLGNECTRESVRTFPEFGTIIIFSHGAMAKDENWFVTGEEGSKEQWQQLDKPVQEIYGIASSSGNEKNYWAIRPKFMDSELVNRFHNSIVYNGSCNSLNGTSMSLAFINNGAKTYYGFDNFSNEATAPALAIKIFDKLVREKKTTGTALDLLSPSVGDGALVIGRCNWHLHYTHPIPWMTCLNLDGAKDVSYACELPRTYVLADTGQTQCYDNAQQIPCPAPGNLFYGQDGNYQSTPPVYRDNGDGSVTDITTGLMWQRGDEQNNNNIRPWQNGVEYCENLDLAGHSDWRLPTSRELMSVVDFGRDNPAIDTSYFPECRSGGYWSSDSFLPNPLSAWFVSFENVGTFINSKDTTLPFHVRCVRGLSQQGEYVDNGNGTITNTVTKLVWQQTDDGQPRTWREALSYCEDLNLAGFDDWRLPNVRELDSIVERHLYSPSIDPSFDCRLDIYWTSTTATSTPLFAKLIEFGSGSVGAFMKNYSVVSESSFIYARCVRGGIQ